MVAASISASHATLSSTVPGRVPAAVRSPIHVHAALPHRTSDNGWRRLRLTAARKNLCRRNLPGTVNYQRGAGVSTCAPGWSARRRALPSVLVRATALREHSRASARASDMLRPERLRERAMFVRGRVRRTVAEGSTGHMAAITGANAPSYRNSGPAGGVSLERRHQLAGPGPARTPWKGCSRGSTNRNTSTTARVLGGLPT